MTDPVVLEFLIAFGYLTEADSVDDRLVKDAIAKAQEAYGLPVTGVVDEVTKRILTRTPRCGMSDAPQHTIGKPHWGITELAWCLTAYVPRLSRDQVDQAVTNAFASWSAVTPLKFRQVNNAAEANIVIGVGRGTRANFDGPSGTLAWMYLTPSENYRGQLQGMFDGDENWLGPNASGAGVLLENVACHEIGHALGLMHSQRKDQLMSPFYSAKVAKPLAEDVARIQELYGQATVPPPTSPGAVPSKVQVLLSDNSVYQFENPTKLR